jgi:tetratricopeptide (TPR) repeat protein
VSSQNERLDQAPLSECQNAINFALSKLVPEQASLPDPHKKEMEFWWRLASQDAQNPPKTQAEEAGARDHASRAGKALLLILSAREQERAVELCPSEVKYHVFLGLAYEELFKITALPDLKQAWFDLALAEYSKGAAMNPRNAYYHGNLGRLYSLKVESGDLSALADSEKHYMDAVALGPSTKLFYENLILLYAEALRPESAAPLLEKLKIREPQLSAQLYFSAGSTFYQWARNYAQKKLTAESEKLKTAAMDSLNMAMALDPGNADIPYVLGAIYFNDGKKKEAKLWMEKALRINPDHKLAKDFLTANKI